MDKAASQKLYRLVGIIILAMLSLIGFGMLLLSQAVHFYNKPSPSASTTGKIYVTRPAARKQAAQCAVIFEVDGKKYENYGTGCSWFNSGDDVTVLYKTDDPTKAAIDARNVGYIFGIGGLILGIITFLMIKNFLAKLKIKNTAA